MPMRVAGPMHHPDRDPGAVLGLPSEELRRHAAPRAMLRSSFTLSPCKMVQFREPVSFRDLVLSLPGLSEVRDASFSARRLLKKLCLGVRGLPKHSKPEVCFQMLVKESGLCFPISQWSKTFLNHL